MPEVVLEQISKTYQGARGVRHQALTGIDFTVPSGEFAALLGPSGCGKSTTLRIVAGLERADGGDLRIGGRSVTRVPAAERGLAMVFQNYALFPHLSVAENILFGLRSRRVPRAERNARLAEAARQLRLTEQLDRRPAQLSGGQRQRVALGRALVSGAELVLMDEPLSNLDARLRADMRTELRELQQRLGLTVLYVTHDQVEAMTMADRVIVMREGGIDQIAAPEELYARPASVRVASFIGSPPMNLLDVRRDGTWLVLDGAEGDGDRVRIEAAGLLKGLPDELPEELVLGVRPEDLVPGPGELTLPAVRIRDELLGADRLIAFRVGTRTVQVRVRADEHRPGGDRLGARHTACHLFDRRTGARLDARRLVGATG
ncbi:ABC transporter ATP-binding protein [Kitasatospora sp. SUK 42]|uniref:ABC transporter ATP-binding protein n=1 Tax=Kitasatospora sp. SUK 42 TaxID=1588882 RepID=UPI0018CBACFE|nr:ATP-binding cassette domain-containing protein [Kitasatospora sp. SUK 42]MBV2155675.1 ATP-binding cassette domain-containing protein [Kitasatospora sp. SUK 42]